MKIFNKSNHVLYILSALFFCSGFSSLILEILWQRKLVLCFGASAPATLAVLTAFFIGVASGSLIAGRMAGASKNPLLFYAFTELWIGIWALCFPLLLLVADKIYLGTFSSWQGSAAAFPVRFCLVILTILPATLGMGATIPAMNQVLRNYLKSTGTAVALAYGVNTFGAVLGTFMSGFVLLRFFGINNTLYLAISLNFIVFSCSLMLSRLADRKDSLEKHPAETVPDIANEKEKAGYGYVLMGCYFLSGFFALALEITWLRLLAILNTDSVVTITLAFGIYLFGYSFGSIVIFPVLAKKFKAHRIYFLANLGIVVSIMGTIPLLYHVPQRNLAYLGVETKTLFNLIMHEGITTVIVLLLPTIFLGMAYPAVCQAIASSKVRIAGITGFFYSLGNFGSVAGILVTGFFLVPFFGIVKTIALLCIAVSVLSFLLLQFEAGRPRRIVLTSIPVVFFVLSSVYFVKGLPFLKIKSVQKEQGGLMAFNDESPKRVRIIKYKEGLSGTVIVTEDPSKDNYRGLFIDDLNVASENVSALLDAKMLAHIPLLLHPRPQSALTIGFGTGATSRSMIQHGISVFAVEIEKEVMKAAPLFGRINDTVMAHPRCTVVIDDARNFLRVTDRTFDVISNDLTRVQYKQNASLYTKENFELIKSRLTAQGISCAFIPYHQLSDADLKILMRTFQAVFPHATLWIADHIYPVFMMIFIGSNRELKIDIAALKSFFSNNAVREDLSLIGIEHPFQMINFLYLDEAGFRKYSDAGPIHTDNHPILEFTSPKSFFRMESTEYALKQIAGLRPRNYSSVIVNQVSPGELLEVEKFYYFSQKVNPASRALYPLFRKESDGSPVSLLMEQIGYYREALQVFPDYKWGQALLARDVRILESYIGSQDGSSSSGLR